MKLGEESLFTKFVFTRLRKQVCIGNSAGLPKNVTVLRLMFDVLVHLHGEHLIKNPFFRWGKVEEEAFSSTGTYNGT